jgi:hypothetical protein
LIHQNSTYQAVVFIKRRKNWPGNHILWHAISLIVSPVPEPFHINNWKSIHPRTADKSIQMQLDTSRR